MPNRHYCEPREDTKMGDCNLSHFANPKNEYCKYSYSSWCSTCERSSPRRRSRSETNEPCRRRCKEMKTLIPKKYNRCQEYENMEFEYETKGQWVEKDMRFECCRIRSNLCELPTSYISNNCQTNLTGLPKMSSDANNFVDCLKSVATYEQTLKFVDFNGQLENFGGMQEKSKLEAVRISPNKADHSKNGKRVDGVKCAKNGYMVSKPPPKNAAPEPYRDNHYDYKSAEVKSTCRESCPFVDFKLHELSNRRHVCYDTDTYFNRTNNSIDLRERYSKEVEYLREKLKAIRSRGFGNHATQEKLVCKTDEPPQVVKSKGDGERKVIVTSPVENRPKTKKERKTAISPPLVKVKSRVALKTRAKASAKLRKVKAKPTTNNVSSGSDCAESDYSGSDSEIEDEDLDRDPESISEPLTDRARMTCPTLRNFPSVPRNRVRSGDAVSWPIRPSLFPNIPPYIHFNSHDSAVEFKIPNGRRFFKWKLSTITPVVVRKTLTNSGFAGQKVLSCPSCLSCLDRVSSSESNQWLGTWGEAHEIADVQDTEGDSEVEPFPGTFQLGRKDRLWRNFQKMIAKYGHKEFGFLPQTYVLPQELRLLKQNWEFKNGNGGEMWIIKPPASARGTGIKVINKWSHLPKKTSLVVQKYISNPYLINGSKFDLRLYVLVTSFNPLRIYLYPDGLARFASVKYSDDAKDLKDRYMHLTNYSINKLSSQYTANEDANACQGHKWTISKLMEYLHKTGVDTKQLWKNLQQLVIKTIIACEAPITQLCDDNMNNNYNCYELFGVDVLLDEKLKPWLLEVNISPSLHSASPLDAHVKGPLVQTLFDLAQFHLPPGLAQAVRVSPKCYDARVYTTALTRREKAKHVNFAQFKDREDYLYDVLRDLTGDDVRHLARAEDEFVVKGRFERIFPTAHTHKYLNYMETRYYNRLFDAWEAKYAGRREDGIQLLQTLCAQKVHLKVALPSAVQKSVPSTTPSGMSIQPSREGQDGSEPPPWRRSCRRPASRTACRPRTRTAQRSVIRSGRNVRFHMDKANTR
ncbi:hypothetical protein NQ318_022357 [Aromia moschata]|uniref:Tubulin polyglutamylase TTLL4 n=1 Tax=Aromia moschata TaxID=1265417 RepID=A0AAV8Z530_9CUCU|nr:hypothetical protein NQ318_022357 [Aromia moschata]